MHIAHHSNRVYPLEVPAGGEWIPAREIDPDDRVHRAHQGEDRTREREEPPTPQREHLHALIAPKDIAPQLLAIRDQEALLKRNGNTQPTLIHHLKAKGINISTNQTVTAQPINNTAPLRIYH